MLQNKHRNHCQFWFAYACQYRKRNENNFRRLMGITQGPAHKLVGTLAKSGTELQLRLMQVKKNMEQKEESKDKIQDKIL